MAETGGTELPVRFHDLLLAMAGRVDDDALSEIRELIAVAELDRAADLLVGCLVAGRVAVTARERVEISRILDEVRSDPGLADDLVVTDDVPAVRHRFSSGSEPGGGLAEALRGVVDVLPDVLAVGSTWRVTPAGASPGPLPQRVVLVEVGPNGFPPATAYRVEHVLRGAGVRAVVEVLRPGVERTEYHQQAAAAAQPVAFAGGPNGSTTFEPASRHASRRHRAGAGDSDRGADRAGAAAERPAAAPTAEIPVEGPSTIEVTGTSVPQRPVPVVPARIELSAPPADPGHASESLAGAADLPAPGRPSEPESLTELDIPSTVADHHEQVEPSGPAPSTEHDASHVQAQDAEEEPTATAQSSVDASAQADREPSPESNASAGRTVVPPPLPPSVDGKLNDKERELLRQLHAELAQREQQRARRTSNGGSPPSNRWQIDRSGDRQAGFSQTMHGIGGRPGAELVNGSAPQPPFPPVG